MRAICVDAKGYQSLLKPGKEYWVELRDDTLCNVKIPGTWQTRVFKISRFKMIGWKNYTALLEKESA